MANGRYRHTNSKKNNEGNRVYKTTIYPDLDGRNAEDTFFVTETGRRLDRLADEFYDDPTQWWVIAEANNLGRGTMFVEAGTRLRIPTNLSNVYNKLRRKNEDR